jgi:hypothetical protein
MTKQFENPEETKLEDETIADASPLKRIERVTEKQAEKASHTEQRYDRDHDIFSK